MMFDSGCVKVARFRAGLLDTKESRLRDEVERLTRVFVRLGLAEDHCVGEVYARNYLGLNG